MESTTAIHLVAVPFPGRGHINPMLNFCDILLSSNTFPLTISFVVTEEWLSLLDPSLHPNIDFRTIPNVLPSEHIRSAHYKGFLKAVHITMESPFEALFSQLQPTPTYILGDTLIPWVVSFANHRAIPIHSFFPMSPTIFWFLLHFDLFNDLPENKPLPYVSPSLRKSDFDRRMDVLKFALASIPRVRNAQGVIFNVFYELEHGVVDTIRRELPLPIHTVGPTIPFARLQDNGDDECLSWLESQPKDSVLYVALGSFIGVSSELMEALAMGLRDSGVRFLWAARGGTSRARELCGGSGMVVEWCDQLRVLCHPSVGAFLTHCGWNSTLEGVFSGKPMIGLPFGLDQNPNAALIAEEWKVGVRLGGGIGKEEIAEEIRKIMDLDGDESKEMRNRSRMLMEKCRAAVGENGSSRANLDGYRNSLLSKFV